MNKNNVNGLHHHRGWLFGWGSVLVILGILAIALSAFSTWISVWLLGLFVFAGGLLFLFNTFKFWHQKWGLFLFHLVMSLLYLLVGAMLLINPVMGAVSLTLLLAIFFIALGAFRIISAVAVRLPQWGWSVFSGVITLLLGILIMIHWPESGLFIIGLFIGIELLLIGWAYIALAFSLKNS